MGKGSRLGDRPVHGDGNRIIRSRVGARAAARPIAETITVGWRCTDANTRASRSPAAGGTYLATNSSVHGQVIFGAEFRREGRLLRCGDGMCVGSFVTPVTKVVAISRAAAFRHIVRDG